MISNGTALSLEMTSPLDTDCTSWVVLGGMIASIVSIFDLAAHTEISNAHVISSYHNIW